MGSGWLAVGREDPACQVNCGLEPVRSLAWTSRDGLSWEVVPDQEALLGGGMNAVSAFDGGYVAAGVSAGHAAIWTSPDGATWSRVPDAAAFHARPGAGAATDTAANWVASSDGIVVVAGADTNDGYKALCTWLVTGRLVVTRTDATEFGPVDRVGGPAGRATTRIAQGGDPAWLSAGLIVYAVQAVPPSDPPASAPWTPDKPGAAAEPAAEGDRPAPAPDGRSDRRPPREIDVGETWIMARRRVGRRGCSTRGHSRRGRRMGPGSRASRSRGLPGRDRRRGRPGLPGPRTRLRPGLVTVRGSHRVCAHGGQGASIRTVNVSTGEVAILVTTPAGSEVAAPTWLADGRLLFVQDGNIWLFDPAQSAPVQVTTAASIQGGSLADALAVSPYGGWIAYVTGTQTDALVELSNLAGNRGMSFPWTGPVTQPAWAPKVTPPAGEPGTSPPRSDGAGRTRRCPRQWVSRSVGPRRSSRAASASWPLGAGV